MNIHVAAFTWHESASSQQVTDALKTVQSLERLVPGVTAIYVGENTSQWGKGYTHVVVVVGDSAEAIDAYREHPVHLDVAKDIESMELDGVGLDFRDAGR